MAGTGGSRFKPTRPGVQNPNALRVQAKGGGLSVILPSVGFDEAQRGFAVLPALWAAIRQGRVAWGHLMVSSAAMQSGLPSNWAHAFYLIHAATLPKITLKTAHLKNTLSERGGAAWSPRRPRHGLLGKFR